MRWPLGMWMTKPAGEPPFSMGASIPHAPLWMAGTCNDGVTRDKEDKGERQ